ncbi:APC amino acid permease [Mycena rosella]|uniref:APC amino acid permease n=1 Tax=Mycena rosella TaxID=1033263 RepID=A0AAD7GLJ7_MYCRO|nr:APC amino acid permease [Mycena rosella]
MDESPAKFGSYEHETKVNLIREPISDEDFLATLGYKQELRREFSPVEVFGIGFSIIGLFPSISSVLFFSLPYGAVGMVWGWAVCVVFLTFMSLALAELASAAPTTGGLYYWSYAYSTPKWRRLLSWIVGYTNTISNIAGVCSIDWGCALQITSAASIGSNFTFVPTVGHNFGVFCALVISHAAVCSLSGRIIARLQKLYITFNIVLVLGIIIGMPIATSKEFKNDARFAFGDLENFSLWPNGYGVILSFIAPLWVIGGLDSCVHMSEEVSNAAVAVPWGIVAATTLSGVLGWAVNVTIAFCMGTDIGGILGSVTGQPMSDILFNSFGQKGALAIWALVAVTQFMMGTSSLTASSRQTWAFARDGALPFSSFFHRINSTTGTPVNCVWMCAGSAILLGLLAFAGPTAINAIFSLAVACQYIAYSIPISARFLGGKEFKRGPFHLGIFSLPVAVIAVAWMSFMVVVVMFPTSPIVDSGSMNYSCVVLGGTLSLAVGYYYFPKVGGVYWFEGPVKTVHDGQSYSADSSDGKENVEKSSK